MDDYGKQDYYIALSNTAPYTSTTVSYGELNGEDYGELIISNPDVNSGNILVIGDSYDNAILKLIASHFSKLYSVDLRYYEHLTEQIFDFDTYVSENNIDTVLFIGSSSFWK